MAVAIPLARVKAIIRSDEDVNAVAHDATVLVAKATVRKRERGWEMEREME